MKLVRILIATILAISFIPAISQLAFASEPGTEPVAVVASVSPNNDPYGDRQWALPQLPVRPATARNSEILVAILDTGIDVNHEDLAGKVIDSNNFTGSKTTEDINGHGTHVAGIITANRNNSIGIAGVAPNAKLLNVKVAEDNGTVWASNVAKGIIWATDKGANVINMSLVVPSKYQPLEDAIDYAWRHGVVLIAAAGNHSKTTTYPAAYNNVIAAAAITPDNKLWAESNDGEFVDAYAPGVSIVSTLPGNSYGAQSGSSMASAYVSAVAAQLFNQVTDSNNDGNINDDMANLMRTLLVKPGK